MAAEPEQMPMRNAKREAVPPGTGSAYGPTRARVTITPTTAYTESRIEMDRKSLLNENRQGDSQYNAGRAKVTAHAIQPTICNERSSDEAGNRKGEKMDIGKTTRNHAVLCNQM